MPGRGVGSRLGGLTWTASCPEVPGTNNAAAGDGVVLDGAGQGTIVGRFFSAQPFGSVMLTAKGKGDIFVATVDPAGQFVWATAAGGFGEDSASAIALDRAGNAYVAGSFSDTAQLGGVQLSSSGGSDAFVWKLRPGEAR